MNAPGVSTTWRRILFGLLVLGLERGASRAEDAGGVPKPESAAAPKPEAAGVPQPESAAVPQPETTPAVAPKPEAAAVEPMDFTWFVRRIGDLDSLPYVARGLRSTQHSSYDRASKLGPQGEKLDWGANGDAGNYIRKEANGEAVMAEMDGPGVLVQTWSANPQGKLHIYIDGAETPIVFDFTAFTTGGIPEIPAPISTKGGGAGANSYLPIPYAKRCVIKADKAHGQYFHFDFLGFPAGTPVVSFQWPLSTPERDALAAAAKAWETRMGEDPGAPRKGSEATKTESAIPGGGTRVIADLAGPRVITRLGIRLDSPARWARREVLLRAFWDGEAKPSIECPVGDFFSSAWGDVPFRSLPVGMTLEGGYTFFRMPFARSARIELVNEGSGEVRVRTEVVHAPTPWTPEACYFHAKWRRDAPNQVFDWPCLRAEGRGRFVGMALSVQNPDPPWFGEGDEKIWVDGEAFPSWFGTGTEDYFCDAWGFRPFIQPTHGCTLYAEPGRTTVYRWHVLDSIPFEKSFEFTLENYAGNKDYSAVLYWYASPPNEDDFAPTVLGARLPWALSVPGATEAESVSAPGAPVVGDEGLSEELSGGKALRLAPGGAEVELNLPVESQGVYRVVFFGPKGQAGAGLVARHVDSVILDAAAPAFAKDGRLAASKKVLVLSKGSLTLHLAAKAREKTPSTTVTDPVEAPGGAVPDPKKGLPTTGEAVIVDALRLERASQAPGAVEAEALLFSASADAAPRVVYVLEGDQVSGSAGVAIQPKAKGESLDLKLDPALQGRHQIVVRLVRGPAGGMFDVSAAGKPLATAIDGYLAEGTPSEEIVLGVAELPGGEANTLRFVGTGKAAASRGFELFVDYVRTRRVVVSDAIEAESLPILAERDSLAQHQMLGEAWSQETQLFCPGKEDQFIELALSVAKAGRYSLAIYFTRASDYGIVRVEVDGKPVGEPMNGYHDGVSPSGKIDFGTLELGEGAHRIAFHVKEKDPRASHFFMGIDCLTLTPAP